MAWNGSDKGERVKGEKVKGEGVKGTTFNFKALVAGLVVILGGGLIAWFFLRQSASHQPHAANHKSLGTAIAEVKAAAATNSVPKGSVVSQNHLARTERGVEVVAVTTRTNQSGVVVENLTLADGRKIQKVVPPKPIFDNPSDQMIALALSTRPGQSMAPLPSLGNMDKEFARSLLTPISINEDDSDTVKELKLSVKEARAYIAAEIKAGRTVAECLQAHRGQMEDIADSHAMALQEMQKMKHEGATKAEIAEFRARINEVFREKGIPELSGRNKKATGDDTPEVETSEE